MTQHYLSPLFNPRSVAVVGAGNTAGKVGAVVFANLLQSGFKGAICAVNPRHAEVQGHPCYASLEDLPEAVDLVAIATPSTTVPDLIETAGRRRVRAAVVMSAGFSEIGPKGRSLE
jgi:acetyltransferase